MKRLACSLALAVIVDLLLAPPSAANDMLPSSPLSAVYVEPAAGYGFFSSAISSARHEIDLSMYELRDPAIEAQLVRQAQRGVRVRVLLNAAYYGRSENVSAASVLSRGGVHVSWAPQGQIFHAKYLVIDHARVYIGTGNLVNFDYSSTRDFWVLDSVPGDVAAVETTFSDDVNAVSRAPASHGGLVWSPGSASTLEALISGARHTLSVENEEMENDGIEAALDAAAARGVHVSVVMTDSTSYVSELTALVHHGVHVTLLSSSRVYIHAKVLCADCSTTSGTAFVGSENFSTSSLDYNRELGVITHSVVVIGAVAGVLNADADAGTRM
jgi:phosphatidylserine/phosphatidylglycerophosphate/cardiolipin synthase-like enzyme